MLLGTEVGLGPVYIVLDGDLASPHRPQFSTHVCCGQTDGWMKMPLGKEVGLDPGHIVLDGGPSSLAAERGIAAALLLAHVYCGQSQTVAHISYC